MRGTIKRGAGRWKREDGRRPDPRGGRPERAQEHNDQRSMTMTDNNLGNDSYASETGAGTKRFKDRSPEETKEAVKTTVQRGLSTVTGAVEGAAETLREADLAGTTKEALEKVGEAARTVVATGREQAMHIRDAVKGKGSMEEGSIGYRGEDAGGLGGPGEDEDPTFRTEASSSGRALSEGDEDEDEDPNKSLGI